MSKMKIKQFQNFRHYDFIFNGGTTQPVCKYANWANKIQCSHNMAITYYLQSISNPGCFSAIYYKKFFFINNIVRINVGKYHLIDQLFFSN